MEWFSGNIPQAIQTSKSRGSIFVVYITGDDDDDSKHMDEAWNNPDVSQMCKKGSVVAIKISASSEACTFFSQIYPVVILPAAYFIGDNGTPLEVIGGKVELQTFKEKVKNVLELYRNSKSLGTASQPQATSTRSDKPHSADPTSTKAAVASSRKTGAEAAEEVALDDTSSDENEDTSKGDIQVRVERAKEKIEQRRTEKARKEAEEERQKEIERRKFGQNVQQLRQNQHEQELREVKEQLRKEKEEQRKARERIKQEIERDRAERNAKFQKEKFEKQQVMEEARRNTMLKKQKEAAEAEVRRSEIARIQFRFPDGASVSQQFPSSQTLQAAYDFISERFGGAVTLSTAFPKRTFCQEDLASTFIELELAPTAVILVVPVSGLPFGSRLGNSGGGGILSLLVSPFVFIWNFFMSLIFPAPAVTNNSNSSAQAGTSAAGGDRTKSSTNAFRRPAGGNRSRQDGNIRRLRNSSDEEDENATWNGNSTQQM